MSQVSKAPEYGGRISCIVCGMKGTPGGHYCGHTELVICADCLRFNDLRCLGVALGDAILDLYRRGFPRDEIHPIGLVENVLKRIESAMWRAIACGYYLANEERPGRGLRDD